MDFRSDVAQRLKAAGVFANPFDDAVLRFVTNREVTCEMVLHAVELIKHTV